MIINDATVQLDEGLAVSTCSVLQNLFQNIVHVESESTRITENIGLHYDLGDFVQLYWQILIW